MSSHLQAESYGLGSRSINLPDIHYPPSLEKQPQKASPGLWTLVVWAFTFWAPSLVLQYAGRIKLPEARMAWREKVTIFLIFSAVNAAIMFVTIKIGGNVLIIFGVIFGFVRGVKILSALAHSNGSKNEPPPSDKFVIFFVPVYTEDEAQIRRTLESLSLVGHDNKRKLICVICDGIVKHRKSERVTPKIVLDIFGVDPKIHPPALPFLSVGHGAEKLNYAKVYSGLYEHGPSVLPYITIVKVGKETEQSTLKPGHRGKRDSQVLLLSFLNRVHHRSPMSPLQLEMFHQINNIIGVDPELYEYVCMVDADTAVQEFAVPFLLNHCAKDPKVSGICGEIRMQNEERSWWTMVQVYEYYTAFHLTRAFESVFGTVTCLPGCFCMYRLRSVDTGRPLVILDKVLEEYGESDVHTLHQNNMRLGEDRYLTTLMKKHLPDMKYAYCGLAIAYTICPDRWSTFLSQRRRWINSTIHNLLELLIIEELGGVSFLHMSIVILVDLLGTIMLPSIGGSLIYLIYAVAKHSNRHAMISLLTVAGIYALSALLYIFNRRAELLGWMIIYLMAFPVFCIILPIYSWWHQDDFTWGAYPAVDVGKRKKLSQEVGKPEPFDPRSIPLQRWDNYASTNRLPGCRSALRESDVQ